MCDQLYIEPIFTFLSIFWNGVAVELQLSQIFQTVFGWSPLSTGVHFIPIGAHVMPFTTSLLNVDVRLAF